MAAALLCTPAAAGAFRQPQWRAANPVAVRALQDQSGVARTIWGAWERCCGAANGACGRKGMARLIKVDGCRQSRFTRGGCYREGTHPTARRGGSNCR